MTAAATRSDSNPGNMRSRPVNTGSPPAGYRSRSAQTATSPSSWTRSSAFGFCQAGLLVDADHVPRGVAKRCDNLAGIGVNRLHDLTPGRDDRFNRGGGIADHDVNHQPGLGRDRPSDYPCAADLVDGVVEGRRTVAALSRLPTEGTPVELGRLLVVLCGNLDVANLAGPVRRWLNQCRHCPSQPIVAQSRKDPVANEVVFT